MAKFNKPFPEELMLSCVNCFGGVYSKGIFNYTWHYKTKHFIFQFNDITLPKDGACKTVVEKIVKRTPWYQPNVLIYNKGWIFGHRSCEYRVQKDFDAMIFDFKEHQRKAEELTALREMKYKDVNDLINS